MMLLLSAGPLWSSASSASSISPGAGRGGGSAPRPPVGTARSTWSSGRTPPHRGGQDAAARPCCGCTRPASSSTFRCLETACRDTSYGAASSPTVASADASRATMSRRVGSARAANIFDSRSACSTTWLSKRRCRGLVNPWLNTNWPERLPGTVGPVAYRLAHEQSTRQPGSPTDAANAAGPRASGSAGAASARRGAASPKRRRPRAGPRPGRSAPGRADRPGADRGRGVQLERSARARPRARRRARARRGRPPGRRARRRQVDAAARGGRPVRARGLARALRVRRGVGVTGAAACRPVSRRAPRPLPGRRDRPRCGALPHRPGQAAVLVVDSVQTISAKASRACRAG